MNQPKENQYECDVCGDRLPTQAHLDRHIDRHNDNSEMFECPDCDKAFARHYDMTDHWRRKHDPDFVKYECQYCSKKFELLVGKVLKSTELVKHWGTHQKRGHVSQDKELEYIPAEQPRFNGSLPLFLAILKHSITLKDNADNLNEEHDDDDSRGLEEQENDDAVFDHDVDILRQNEEWWSPGIETNGLILEPCPNGVVIELDTAILNNSRGRKVPTLSLDSRCVKCHAEMRMRQLTKRFDSPHRLDYDLAKLGDEFATAASERWSYPSQYAQYEATVRKPVRDIRLNGQHTGPRKFVIIDTEFNPTTRELCETAIIDRVTGEVLINTVIRHTDATKTAPLPSGTVGQKMEYITNQHRKKFYPSSGELAQMDVDQVAETLQRSGITPETIFICWHNNKFDLTILREFLRKGGYTDILPGDDKCFPLIPIFKKNAPKSLSLRLEVLFQVLYPAHSLIGHNHRALPDCQQARLVCDCLDEMFEKPENRSERWKGTTLRRFYKKTKIQQSIADWLQPDKKRNADGLNAELPIRSKRPRRQ
ncbi:zinc finger protein [Fusarium tjaetaba]|uniref:Zinc finger protein n=1 Tax=Fusarium tjaetaba TaxID=1567544 RepID=A0A8H5R249_9HYPO|nr:zinc finger protein [Fusarium tjaetaba]KAF5625155.1 zinc finger protein [Fusarium tjaetaba]